MERESQVRRTVAIVTVILLVSMTSGVAMINSTASNSASTAHSFIGTTPDAAEPAVQPATF